MADLRATPRNGLLGLLADAAQGTYDFGSKPFGYDNPPVEMVMKALGIPALAKTLDNASYGGGNTRGTGFARQLIPDAREAMLSVLPGGVGGKAAAPVAKQAAKQTGKALSPQAEKMLMDYAMKMGGVKSIYLPTKPSNPIPEVGSRFNTVETGQFVPEVPKTIEDYKGYSLLSTPWDATSRNRVISGVSDEILPNSVVTNGGPMHGRDALLNEQQAVIASGKEIAKRLQDRSVFAAEQSERLGGTGKAVHAITAMGEQAENFSTDPSNVYLQLIKLREYPQAEKSLMENLGKTFVTKKNAQGKPMKVYPFQNWQGFNQEGIEQLMSNSEMRKAFAAEMSKVRNQMAFGYNDQDVRNAILDSRYQDLPTFTSMGMMLEAKPKVGLLASNHPSYDTAVGSVYSGSMQPVPIDVLMPKAYNKIFEELSAKNSSRNPSFVKQDALAALQKRGTGFSEFVDDQTIESVNRYLEKQRLMGLLD